MKIGSMDLEHAVPGNPLVVERYFVQRQRHGSRSHVYWTDALNDANINGVPTLEMAEGVLARTRESYADGLGWRIIKRVCTVETEVVS